LILALASGAMFGVATPFSKTLLERIQANQLAGLMYLGAALVLLPLVIRRYRTGRTIFPRDGRNRRRLLGAVFFGGMVGPVLMLLGLRYARASSVCVWLNLETTATAVLAFLIFREHLGKWTWLGNAGVLCAGVLLVFGEGGAGVASLLLVSGAAVAWGLDNNFTALIDGISAEDSTFWKGLVAGSINLAIGLALFPAALGYDWLWAVALGAVSYGASISLYIRAAQHMGATRSQMVFASAPFFGVLMSLLWLGETLGVVQIAATLILAGSLALMFREKHIHRHQHHALLHEHEHLRDDPHHGHEHADQTPDRHSHVHCHDPMVHAHPHWPDLHHRHDHE
jgi:drug/metabolite transporter (DMT)-like permease